MIRAIIFDCFGVLLNDGLVGIVSELEKTDPKTAEEIRNIVREATAGGMDAHAARERIAHLLGLTLEQYSQRIKLSEIKNQELLDYIITLRPKFKTAVLSNILAGGLAVRFPDGEAERYFDDMVASGEVGFAKPDKRVYEIAAQRLGVRPEECVFIDDRQSYCDGALNAGMQAIYYESFQQMRSALKALGVNA